MQIVWLMVMVRVAAVYVYVYEMMLSLLHSHHSVAHVYTHVMDCMLYMFPETT